MSIKCKLFNRFLNRPLLIAALVMWTGLVDAHHPHDLIDALAVSPDYSEDETLFIANAEHLLRSTNGGFSWKELMNGLDNANAISDIVIRRTEGGPLHVYLSTLGDGIYRSIDGGNSWTRANNKLGELSIQDLSILPDGTVLAIDSAGGLHLGGREPDWRRVEVPAGQAISALSSVHAGNTILAGSRTGVVLVSRDAGNSWTSLAQLPAATEITVIEPDISKPGSDSYFVGTSDHGLYRTADSGNGFDPLDAGPPGAHITSLAYSPNYAANRTLIVTTWHKAAYISSDAGANWQQYGQGLSTDEQADTPKYYSPQFRSVRFSGAEHETLYLGGFDGLFKSTDGGHSWAQLETLSVGLIKSLALSPRDTDDSYSIALGTYGGGAYISHDRGESWTIGNKGLNTTRLGDVEFSPLYPQDGTLLSGSVLTLLHSGDRGASWEQIHLHYNPLRRRIVFKLMEMGLPRDIGDKFLEHRDFQPVYPNIIAFSPDYARDRLVLFGTRYHGLFQIHTDSREIAPVWVDAPAAITSLAFSPEFEHDRTAFLFVRGDSLYKSTNGGRDWRRITQGLPFESAHTDLAELFTRNDFKIAFSPNFGKDQTIYGGGPMGLFKSTDGGETWRVIDDATLGHEPNIQALGIAPGNTGDSLILVGVKGRGLFHSTDGGSHFAPFAGTLIDDNQSIELLAFSPAFARDNTVYAASDQALFRSTDRGATWKELPRPVRYEDRRDAVHYTGEWRVKKGDRFSASSIHRSSDPDARASLRFAGCGIRWLALRSPEGGFAEVFLDGVPAGEVDLRAQSPEPIAVVFERQLECGPHTIAISPAAKLDGQGRINLDAFDVMPKAREQH